MRKSPRPLEPATTPALGRPCTAIINIGGQDVTEFVSRLNPDLLASA